MDENKRLAYLIDIKTIATGDCNPPSPSLDFASLPYSFSFFVPGSTFLKVLSAFHLPSSRFLKFPLHSFCLAAVHWTPGWAISDRMLPAMDTAMGVCGCVLDPDSVACTAQELCMLTDVEGSCCCC